MHLMGNLTLLVVTVCAYAARPTRHMPPSARRLLERMNRSIDPCEDFYEYACGGLLASQSIQPDNMFTGTVQMLYDIKYRRLARLLSEPITKRDILPVQKAKLFYRSCLNEDEIETHAVYQVLEYLNPEGGTWPTLDSDWDEINFDLELSMAAAQRQNSQKDFGSGPIITMWVMKDYVGPDFIITFLAPKFDIGDKDYIADMLELLGADRMIAEADAQRMLDLNTRFVQLHMSGFYKGMVTDLYEFPGMCRLFKVPTFDIYLPSKGFILHKITKCAGNADLQLRDKIKDFDWLKYLKEVFRETEYVVGETDPIAVFPTNYFAEVITLLNSASKRDVANLIKWRMFQSLLFALPSAFQRRHFEVTSLVTGTKEMESREKYCIKMVNGEYRFLEGNFGMPQAVSRMLMERFYSKREKSENEKIAAKQVKAFVQILEQNEWLSDETKKVFISKVKKVKNERIYPITTFNDDYLEMFYRDFDVSKRCYAKNYISSLLGNTRRNFENIKQPKQLKWFISPSIINAYSDSLQSLIIMTATWLTDPVYDPSFPLAVKLGSGGWISAHELSHLVGPIGSRWTEDATVLLNGSIFSDESYKMFFADKMPCLIDQYNKYEIPYADGLMVNGPLTVTENYADNVGLKIAYQTYERVTRVFGEEEIRNLPFNARKIFFISFAQTFCEKRTREFSIHGATTSTYSPGKWRINGPLRNLPEFADTYSCPANSFMNPDKRCIIY